MSDDEGSLSGELLGLAWDIGWRLLLCAVIATAVVFVDRRIEGDQQRCVNRGGVPVFAPWPGCLHPKHHAGLRSNG